MTGSGSDSDSLPIANAPDGRTRKLGAMKSRDLFKDIFSLMVRLLGLVFLYLGLSAVPPLLDFGAIETAGRSDSEIDALQTRITAEVAASGTAWFSTVVHGGRAWLRFNLLNLHTREEHIHRLADFMGRTARGISQA